MHVDREVERGPNSLFLLGVLDQESLDDTVLLLRHQAARSYALPLTAWVEMSVKIGLRHPSCPLQVDVHRPMSWG